jgi:hypothetical protein
MTKGDRVALALVALGIDRPSAFFLPKEAEFARMAVTNVNEIWEGRRGSQDDAYVVEFVRVFRVFTNSMSDGSLAVRTAVDPVSGLTIPALYTSYSGANEVYIGSTVQKVESLQDSGNPFAWTVTVTYSTLTKDPFLNNPNPLQRLPEISWSLANFSRAIDVDLLGVPIVNSAGQRFDPPIEVDDSRQVLTYIRNESTYDPHVAKTYINAINTDTFLGFEPYAALIKNIGAVRSFENNVVFYRVTYEIHFRSGDLVDIPGLGQVEDLWYPLYLLDHGPEYIDANGLLKKVVDANQFPLNDAPLNGSGGLAPQVVRLTNLSALAPVGIIAQDDRLTTTGNLFSTAKANSTITITGGTNFVVGTYRVDSVIDANNVVLNRAPTNGQAASAGTGVLAFYSFLSFDVYQKTAFGPLQLFLF